MKRPSFQFYPADWVSDLKLRSVSLAAKGLWIDMICWMHQSEPYGHFRVGGRLTFKVKLAAIEGCTVADLDPLLDELFDAGVCSLDDEGMPFSRRMVRDEELRQVRAAGGVKGGNPALNKASGRLTSKVNPPSEPLVNLPPEDEEEEEKGVVPFREGGVGEGARSAHAPKWEYALGWLKDAIKNGSDYTEEETKQAWLALDANGWMWGKNPIIQWKSALERRIGDDRDRKESNAKSNHGPRTSGKNHGTADKPLRSRHIMRPGDGSENQPTVKHYPGSEKLAARVAAMFPVAAKAHPDGGDAP